MESTVNHLELMSSTKMQHEPTKKKIIFLHTTNVQLETEIEKIILYGSSKKNYLGVST